MTIKRQHEGGFHGDGGILYLDCGGHCTNDIYTWDKSAQNYTHTHTQVHEKPVDIRSTDSSNVHFWVVTMWYSYITCYKWQNLGQGDTRPPVPFLLFAANLESF